MSEVTFLYFLSLRMKTKQKQEIENRKHKYLKAETTHLSY